MTGSFKTTSRYFAALSCLSMLASPAFAAAKARKTVPIAIPLSARPDTSAWKPADETFNDHRSWRRYRGHNGIDGGDVLGGLLILGGIAAVAAAIDKDKQERRERTQGSDYPYPQRPYDYRSGSQRPYEGGGLSSSELTRAVDACSAEAGRSGSVDQIFDVDKIDGEWRVRGDYAGGREFTCTVDSNGRAYVGTAERDGSDGWAPRGDEQDDTGPRAEVIGSADDDRYASGKAPDFEDPRGE